MKIKLNRGYAIIDSGDFDLVSVYTWHEHNGYVFTDVSHPFKMKVAMHRLIMGLKYGDNRHVDHINGDGLDNRRSNLRVCTASQNCANARISKNNTSGYKGVSYDKRTKRWFAQITVKRKHIHLGRYKTAIEAARVYDKAAREYFGEYAKTNF